MKNRKLIRRVARFIEKYPEAYDQCQVLSSAISTPETNLRRGPAVFRGSCGCVFSLAVALTPMQERPKQYLLTSSAGKELLGLTDAQATRMFAPYARHTPASLRKFADS